MSFVLFFSKEDEGEDAMGPWEIPAACNDDGHVFRYSKVFNSDGFRVVGNKIETRFKTLGECREMYKKYGFEECNVSEVRTVWDGESYCNIDRWDDWRYTPKANSAAEKAYFNHKDQNGPPKIADYELNDLEPEEKELNGNQEDGFILTI